MSSAISGLEEIGDLIFLEEILIDEKSDFGNKIILVFIKISLTSFELQTVFILRVDFGLPEFIRDKGRFRLLILRIGEFDFICLLFIFGAD